MLTRIRHIIYWGLPAVFLAFLSIPSLQVTQLTDNSIDDEGPVISGDKIIWQQSDGKIISYDILRNYTNELGQMPESVRLSVDAGRVVWMQKDGSADHIYLSSTDNAGVFRINAGGDIVIRPQIKNNMLAWCVGDKSAYMLCLMNLENRKTTRLHLVQSLRPVFCLGSRFLAFSAVENDKQVVRTLDVRTGSLKTISNPGFESGRPFCRDMRVAWQAFDGHDDEIFCYDDYTGYTYRITDNTTDDYMPRLSNNTLCWFEEKENGTGIAVLDFESMDIQSLKANIVGDKHLALSDEFVVWVNGSGTMSRLSIYDIAAKSYRQIANYDFENARPYLSKHLLVWQGSDGSDDEIFICRIDGSSD